MSFLYTYTTFSHPGAELHHRPILLTCKDILDLVLGRPRPSNLQVLRTSTQICSRSKSQIIQVKDAGDRDCQLDVRQALANASAGTDTERVERRLRRRQAVVHGVGGRVCKPALRDVVEGLGEVVGVVVDGIDWDADIDTSGDLLAVNLHATGQNLARESTGDGRCHAHGLVDAGLQIRAAAQLRAGDYLLDIREGCADLLAQLFENLGVVCQVEEGARHSSRGRVRARNDQQVRLTPQLVHVEALASLRVLGVEQVVEEVLAVSLQPKLGTLHSLSLAVLHILRSLASDLTEEQLVQMPVVNRQMRPALHLLAHCLLKAKARLTIKCLCAAFPTSWVANRFAGLSSIPNALPNTKSPMISNTNHSHQCAAFHAPFHPSAFSLTPPAYASPPAPRPSNSHPTLTLAMMYFSSVRIAASLNALLMTLLLRACCILSIALCTLTAAGVDGNAL
ncbi:hypothetical protein B5807_03904 [Epicoccum nigrum]|uniref:Uncharacterized protein n=1 Tax=Epicoccum nigrum TaxID=105696 RepID=A0A1Y2M8G6_EPING|nr:hypothetical protein B5807_03904 [Epicoccum nigrum]